MIELQTEEPQKNRANKWRLYWFHETDLDASYPADAETLAKAGFTPNVEAARVLSELQQGHEREMAEMRSVRDKLEASVGALHRETERLIAERDAAETNFAKACRDLSALRAQLADTAGHARRFEEELNGAKADARATAATIQEEQKWRARLQDAVTKYREAAENIGFNACVERSNPAWAKLRDAGLGLDKELSTPAPVPVVSNAELLRIATNRDGWQEKAERLGEQLEAERKGRAEALTVAQHGLLHAIGKHDDLRAIVDALSAPAPVNANEAEVERQAFNALVSAGIPGVDVPNVATEPAVPAVTKCPYCNRTPCGAQQDRDDARELRICRHATRLERDFLAGRVERVEGALKQSETQLRDLTAANAKQAEMIREREGELSAEHAKRALLAEKLAECADLFEARGQHGIAAQYRSQLALRSQPSRTSEPKDSSRAIGDSDESGKTPAMARSGFTGLENDATKTLPKLGESRVKAEVVTAGETASSATAEAKPAEHAQKPADTEHCTKCGAGPAEPCDRGVDHSEPEKKAAERCRATSKNPAGSLVQCVHPRNHLGVHKGLGKEWPNQGEDYDGRHDAPQPEQKAAFAVGQMARVRGSKDAPCELAEVMHVSQRARFEGSRVLWDWEQLEPADPAPPPTFSREAKEKGWNAALELLSKKGEDVQALLREAAANVEKHGHGNHKFPAVFPKDDPDPAPPAEVSLTRSDFACAQAGSIIWYRGQRSRITGTQGYVGKLTQLHLSPEPFTGWIAVEELEKREGSD